MLGGGVRRDYWSGGLGAPQRTKPFGLAGNKETA